MEDAFMALITRKGLFAATLLLIFWSVALPQTPTSTTVYVYDELGRLKAVINPSGDTAVYTYDAAGNILSISRQISTAVSIIEFTPDEGVEGAAVTIYGTGFSLTPSENMVSFNGVTSSVTASSANQIITSVPLTATSGPITVTTPTGTATSSIAFVVQRSLAITSFTPTIGTPGTAVSINGTSLDSTPANDQVKFNISTATVSAATSTTIDTTVPAGATSGRISLTTLSDSVVSTEDFFVPPSPNTAASVDFTARMAFGETRTITVNAPNHVALVVFDGATGQRISLQGANNTISSSALRILKPDGANLVNLSSLLGNWFIDTLTLPVTGTYTILIDPNSTFTGSLNLTLHNVPADATATITAGGPAVTVTTTVPGQNANVTFAGTAGQRISLNLNNITISSSSVTIRKPDGTTLTSAANVSNSLFFDAITLPITGTYSIAIDPNAAATGSATLTLYTVPADVTGTIAIGGAHVVVTISTPGENARLTFNGTAGQIVELDWWGTLVFPLYSHARITKPDGSVLQDDYGLSYSDDVYLLPVTGTYTIEIDPEGASTGSSTFALYEIPQPIIGSIEADGQPITVTIPTGGQIAKLTFNGTEGQRVSLKIDNIKFGPYYAYVELRGPDGSYPGYTYVYPEESNDNELSDYFNLIDTITLPATGTYSITIYPDYDDTGSMDFTLYNVPPDITGTITPGGPPVTVTTTVPGQDARLTFSGTAGQRVSLRVTDTVFPSYPYVCILNSNSFLFDFSNGCFYSIPVYEDFSDSVILPYTGTYFVRVNQYLTVPGTATINLYEVPPPVTGTLTMGGPPVTVTTTAPGQDAEMTFNGTVGQRMSLKVSGTLPKLSYITIHRPTGQIFSPFKYTRQIGSVRGELIETLILPATGTYKIKVDGNNGAGTMTFNLYEVPAEINDGVITIDGPPVTVTSTADRQNRRLTFQGTAGQMVYVKVNNDTSLFNHVWLYRPDGNVLGASYADNASTKLIEPIVLPVSGTYSILTELFAEGDSVTLSLGQGRPDITGTLVLDGQPLTINVPTAKQVARYTFNGTAGQRVGIKTSDVTMRSGSVTISGLQRECCGQQFVGSQGIERERFSLWNISTTGPNALLMDPNSDYTGGLTLRPYDVPPDVTGTITPNGPAVTVTAAAPGQNATLTFNGTTGQQLTIHVTNNTIGKVSIEVMRPTGVHQTFHRVNGGSFDLPIQSLPTPGTYSISVNPWRANTGSVTLSVTSP
jgi:YD repeat-containing protein